MNDERQRSKSGCSPIIAGAMVAIVTAFAGFGMWAEAQQGLTLRVASESWSPGITAGEIGLTPMDAPGGTTDEVATANVTAFNNFFSTGWRTRGKTLVLDAKEAVIEGAKINADAMRELKTEFHGFRNDVKDGQDATLSLLRESLFQNRGLK